MPYFYKRIIGVFVLIAQIVFGAVGCAKTEQPVSPVFNHVELLPEPETTEDKTRKADVTESVIQESEALEDTEPETEIEEITPESEAAEDTEHETAVGESTEPTEEPDFTPYDIPLSAELQRYTYDLCEERGLDFEIVLALMYAESSYRPHIISRTNDYGIMQINRVNHRWLAAELGITDFLDAEQNINAGTFVLMNISEEYPDVHQMLMVYNMGESGARNRWNRGIYSSGYSRKITAMADELRSP